MNRILITGAGGPAGAALAEQLQALGHTVIGVDMAPIPGAFCAEQHRIAPAADPAFLGQLLRIARDSGAQLIIPTVSEELTVIADAAAEFPEGIRVLIGAAAAVRAADDKYRTMLQLRDRGVAVPRFALPSAFGSLGAATRALGDPLIVKPRISRGGRGVRLLAAADGDDWEPITDDQLVQEFAPGIEYAPVVYASPRGQEARAFLLEKTGLKQGLVGNATGVRRVPRAEQPEVAALAERAVAALGLTGPVDLDIRLRADGSPVVLEVNARFGANSRSAPELLALALLDTLAAPRS